MIRQSLILIGSLFLSACQTAGGTQNINSLAKVTKENVPQTKSIYYSFMIKNKAAPEIASEFSEKIKTFESCFQTFLNRSQGSDFQVMGEWEVNAKGVVTKTKIQHLEPRDLVFKECLKSEMSKLSFTESTAHSDKITWILNSQGSDAKNGPPYQLTWPTHDNGKIYQ